jgi:hypothetical protein
LDATKVKVIETEQATLLIQDYQPTPDGRLELHPCTIIFYSGSGTSKETAEAGAGDVRQRRPIVIQAPQGAALEFSRALDLGRGEFGRLEKGVLAGEITISSPPTRPGAKDEIFMTTRQVRLDRDRIFTPHDVEFRYGESSGRGRDLTIALLNKKDSQPGKKRSSLGGVQSLTLTHLDRLRISTAGDGFLGVQATVPAGAQAGADGPLEITCRGPFTFDLISALARFEDQVEVLRINREAPPDSLRCDQLTLEMALRKAAAIGEESKTPKLGTEPRLGADKKVVSGPSPEGDQLTSRVRRIVAVGSPATLEVPTRGIRAVAATLDYSIADRRITLRSDAGSQQTGRVKQVSLQQFEQHCIARELDYELAEAGRLGRLVAMGPGELRMLQGSSTARQTITARWEDKLLIRPDGRNRVISLEGAASVTADPLGRFDANEMHLWVLEMPLEVVAEATQEKPTTPEPTRGEPKAKTTIVPDRLLATGKVRLASPQLDAETARLEAWFINVPIVPREAATTASGPAASISGPALHEPVARVGLGQSAPPLTPPAAMRATELQKFHAEGELMQMQLLVQGQKFDLENLLLKGMAKIDETRTPEMGQEPIHIAGELVELRRGTTPEAKIEITGKPAEAGGRGLMLAGGVIHVHRGENLMWIDGPGEATLPATEGAAGGMLPVAPSPPVAAAVVREPTPGQPVPRTGAPSKLHIHWQQGLKFDGETATLSGDVESRTATQLARSRTLEARFSQRINFLTPQGNQQAEIKQVRLDGGVFIENRGLDERGQQISLDQLNVPNLTVDRAAGTLHADGPGWFNTVRKSGGGIPGAPAGAGSPPQIVSPLPGPGGNNDGLTSIHVEFERAIEGNLARREIQFQYEVKTTYSPAQQFTDRIVAGSASELSERGVLMTSDFLTVNDMVTPTQRWAELLATGHVHLEGRTFTVQAVRVAYTSQTELLTIEGDGRADAEIWQRSVTGQEPNHFSAQKCMYNLRGGNFEGAGSTRMVFPGSGGMKFPKIGR